MVDLGFAGDSVHLVPACWELRRKLSEAELHTPPPSLAASSSPWPRASIGPGPIRSRTPVPVGGHLDILRSIRRGRFEVALSFSGGDRPILVTALSGARRRVAHDNGRHHFYNRWLVAD